MLPEQGDEARPAERCVAQLAAGPFDEGEGLRAALAQGDQQSASRGELFREWRRHRGTARRDENRVVGGVAAPAQGAVAQEHRHVDRARLTQRPLRGAGERLDPLDRKHLPGQGAEQGGLIARAGADLQNPLRPAQPQGFEIAGLGERLRDRLTLADRQRCVLVRAMPHRLGHEEVARRLGERLQDRQIANAFRAQCLDEPRAVARVGVGGTGQSPASHRRTTSISR